MASGAVAAASQRYISMLWKEAAVGTVIGLVSTSGGSPFFCLGMRPPSSPFCQFEILIYILLSYYFRLLLALGTSQLRLLRNVNLKD